ncbi:hypothetical protein C900_00198 [Fulvivirga imtechensis AK7]|uniref:Uncharacterized protein n=1 Tax=Fulvivirga imtechensis AK7 TaxID=1237149 RepID=L8JIG4_9BACT|nr:hypothetical protein C900_00198 [Fulvivirga imtechensis AK7]
MPSSRAGSFFFNRQKEGKRLAKIILQPHLARRWPGILAGLPAFLSKVKGILNIFFAALRKF